MRSNLITSIFVLLNLIGYGQMTINGDILYGNEWIDYDKTYFKFKLAEDGAYRIGYDELVDMGFPISQTEGHNIKIYRLGQQVPLFVSTNGTIGTNDYIEFIGKKNRGELDKHLYINGEQDQLNPEYSLFTDTTTYFLVSDNSSAGLRFTESSSNNQSPNQEFYLHETVQIFSDFHFKPTYEDDDNIQYSHFDVAEGFGSVLDRRIETILNTENIKQTSEVKPMLSLRFGSNEVAHNVEIFLNGNKKHSEIYSSFSVKDLELELEFSELENSNLISLEGTSGNFDSHSLAYAKIIYPREPSISEDYFEFLVEASPVDKIFEFDVNGSDYVVVDLDNNKRTPVIASNGTIKFKVEPGIEKRKIVIYGINSVNEISNVSIKNFIDYTEEDPNFLFLTSKTLYDPNNPLNAVIAYKQYRESEYGGGHDVSIVTAQDIIDQFSYGIERHCLGNKNFAFFIKDKWDRLEYWFNIGKGVQYSHSRKFDNNSDIQQINLVPSYGSPSSDILMLSELDFAVPEYAVGRLAARSEQDVQNYLNKIIQFEERNKWEQTYEDKFWMKRILHLSGGEPEDQARIFQGLKGMKNVIENNDFGAEVTTLRKFVQDNDDSSLAEKATELINTGVSIVTFFGHASPTGFDLSLDDPSQYANYGKYPLIISLGCYSGNIFTPSTTDFGISEDFVLETDKAAIGFLAASGTAYINAQAVTGKEMYDFLGNEFYRQPIGKALQQLAEDYRNSTVLDYRTLMEQLTLHADPYLNLNAQPGVDITLDRSSVKTFPEVISPTSDSFSVEFDLVNIGSYESDTVNLKVIHYSPSNEILQEKQLTVDLPKSRNSASVTLVVPEISAIGKNTIEIIVDYNQRIDEFPNPEAENNNSLKTLTDGNGYCFYILDNGIKPISPSEFAIINDDCPLELIGSTNNALVDEAVYVFEIDTTEMFNSPLLERGEVISTGGLVKWTPSIANLEKTVYYWRLSTADPTSPVGNVWANSSFIYESNGPTGWNQSHYFQYLKNDLQTLELSDGRKWTFGAQVKDLQFNIGYDVEDTQWIKIDGVAWSTLNQTNFGNFIGVFAFGREEIIYFSDVNQYSQIPTPGQRDNFIYHLDTPESRKLLMDFMDNVPEGFRVFISTQMLDQQPIDWHIEDWEADTAIYGYNLFDKFKENGINNIDILKTRGSIPFVIAFEKGGEVIAQEYGEDINSVIRETYKAYWNFKDGKAQSTVIGPAAAWDKIEWSYSDKEEHDEISLSVYGIYPDDTEELLILNETLENIDLGPLNESNYRRCRIEINSSDSWGPQIVQSNRTTPQIDFLRVLYKNLPDLALVTNDIDFLYESDTLAQGETFKIQLPIFNYTAEDMDSSLLSLSLRDSQNNEYTDTIKISAIPAKTQIISSLNVSTKDFKGNYLWNLRVNKEENPEEQYYFNNFALGSLHVIEDKINPILDVTYDGVHINNGDVVSSSPIITICATDENPFLLLNDPNLFRILLETPNSSTPEVIDIDGSDISFTPADENNNKAVLVFNPQNLTDGIYTLTVQTEDVTGNVSGNNSYVNSFEVITRKAISNIYNYPNPFSSSTQFVFNITGDVPPESVVINIYTLSGKLVKQILPEELGPVRIGLNQSEYKWNGTDDFGQKLAAGTYLYKPLYDTTGFEQLGTEGDQLFERGFGKMVIIR